MSITLWGVMRYTSTWLRYHSQVAVLESKLGNEKYAAYAANYILSLLHLVNNFMEKIIIVWNLYVNSCKIVIFLTERKIIYLNKCMSQLPYWYQYDVIFYNLVKWVFYKICSTYSQISFKFALRIGSAVIQGTKK